MTWQDWFLLISAVAFYSLIERMIRHLTRIEELLGEIRYYIRRPYGED
jgi:hypothetical protein